MAEFDESEFDKPMIRPETREERTVQAIERIAFAMEGIANALEPMASITRKVLEEAAEEASSKGKR